ncbi:MAG: VWA domain-containing protein [Victivallales bacterium]|nr:VWA domain-containing protein [Victivallales bacterium]
MNFAYPWLLLLFLPFALAFYYAWRRPLPTLRIPALKPFAPATGSRKSLPLFIPFLLYALATALLIVAAARPRHGDEKVVMRAKGIDIMLCLDLSGSMATFDVPKGISDGKFLEAIKAGKIKPRLPVAMDEIKKFIADRPDDRIGLIGFAELPYSVCPPTLDHGFLVANMERLRPGMIGDKTGIAGPVASAIQRLKDSDAKRRVVVLFTDGSNNVKTRISPLQAAKLAHDYDIILYTVGIGSDHGVYPQRSFGGIRFEDVRGEFDEKLLQEMAKAADGKYYRAFDAKGLGKVMSEINKLEKTTMEQPRYIEYSEFGPKLIVAALVLLLLGFILENTVYLRVP